MLEKPEGVFRGRHGAKVEEQGRLRQKRSAGRGA